VWAYSFDDIIDRTDLEPLRQSQFGQLHAVETIGLLAHLTVEVGVLVVVVVVAVTMAELIAYAVAAAFDGVYEMVLTEECEGSEDIRLVDGLDPALQFG
jgi:hypothetical protein